MSVRDEDDDFFADIYGGGNKKDQNQNQQQPTEPAAPADPRAAVMQQASGTPAAPASDSQTSQPSAEVKNETSSPSVPQPQPAAPAPVPQAQPSAPYQAAPAAVPAPAAPAAPAAASTQPVFDPLAFAKQLQQLQEQALGNNANANQGGNNGLNQVSERKPSGHTEQGYHAGNIFIPAKDEGKMFIGGLNWETTDESMKNYFSAFGEVTEVNVMRDPNTGRSRGFGFLTFKEAQSVTEVLKREHFLDGKIIDPKRAIPREEQDKTAKIFVGGVGMDVTEDDFKNFFEQYGTVIDAQLMIDKDTGRPRGFGFVTFDDHKAVDTIVAEKFLDLKGKSIEVKRAEPRLNRDWQNRNQQQQYRPMQQQQNYYPNAMDPNVMSQYYQQWQAYMVQMQEMMKNGQGMPNMPNMPNGMQGMAGMAGMGAQMQGMPAGMSGGMPGMSGSGMAIGSSGMDEASDPRRSYGGSDDRDSYRDRKRGDERRRSRSPPSNRRRRPDAMSRDPRDRNAQR